jgi:hypothetical protein
MDHQTLYMVHSAFQVFFYQCAAQGHFGRFGRSKTERGTIETLNKLLTLMRAKVKSMV